MNSGLAKLEMVFSKMTPAQISRRKVRRTEHSDTFWLRKLDKMSSAAMLSFFRCCRGSKTLARLLSGKSSRYRFTVSSGGRGDWLEASNASDISSRNTMIIDEEFVRNCRNESAVRFRDRCKDTV